MSKVQFGKRGLRNFTKSWDSLYRCYLENQNYIYNVKEVTIKWSRAQRGSTGTRMFKYYHIPPLKFWNPDVLFREHKIQYGPPSIQLKMMNGSELNFPSKDLNEHDILKQILEVCHK